MGINRLAAAAALAGASLAAGASASVAGPLPQGPATGAPSVERFVIDEHDYDDWVSEQCGFDVWYHVTGHATFRAFGREGTGPLEVFSISTTVVLSSGDKTYRLKDVGSDVTMRTPDGSLVTSINGQVPFGHKGVFRFDPDSGDVLFEPQRLTYDEIDRVCTRLAP